MTAEETIPRIVATPAARAAISGLCRRGKVMFVVSGGCCGGSAPMCLRLGELAIGSGDLLLGEIDGCPCYVDSGLYLAWREPRLVLDVEPGLPEGFSLPAGDGQHFVLHG